MIPCETADILVHVLCMPYSHAPVYSVTVFQTTFIGCMCVLAVTCHQHFWLNDQDLLHAATVTQGWNGYQNKSEQMVDPREENSPTALARTWTCDLSIISPTLCHWRVFTTTTILKRQTGIHCHHFKHWTLQQGKQGQHSGLSSRLMIERSQVRVPAGEFSSTGSTFYANS